MGMTDSIPESNPPNRILFLADLNFIIVEDSYSIISTFPSNLAGNKSVMTILPSLVVYLNNFFLGLGFK